MESIEERLAELAPDDQKEVIDFINFLISKKKKGKNQNIKFSNNVKQDEQFIHWKNQMNFYLSIRDNLLQDPKYNEKYIALSNSEIIDVDDDKYALAKRNSNRPPGKYMVIIKVSPNFPECRKDTPRFKKV